MKHIIKCGYDIKIDIKHSNMMKPMSYIMFNNRIYVSSHSIDYIKEKLNNCECKNDIIKCLMSI